VAVREYAGGDAMDVVIILETPLLLPHVTLHAISRIKAETILPHSLHHPPTLQYTFIILIVV